MGLAEKYFVKGPELWESSRFIYSSILADTVAEHEPNTDDLGRLVMLKWTLGLSSQEVASCHHKVGFTFSFPLLSDRVFIHVRVAAAIIALSLTSFSILFTQGGPTGLKVLIKRVCIGRRLFVIFRR